MTPEHRDRVHGMPEWRTLLLALAGVVGVPVDDTTCTTFGTTDVIEIASRSGPSPGSWIEAPSAERRLGA